MHQGQNPSDEENFDLPQQLLLNKYTEKCDFHLPIQNEIEKFKFIHAVICRSIITAEKGTGMYLNKTTEQIHTTSNENVIFFNQCHNLETIVRIQIITPFPILS